VKRNLVLLTAVVLAAVVLSGCVMWPFGISVTYDLEKDMFEAHKNEKRIKKEVKFEPEFIFAEEASEEDIEQLVVSVTAGKNAIEFTTEDVVDEDEVIGIKVAIPNVGKENITISIKLPEEE